MDEVRVQPSETLAPRRVRRVAGGGLTETRRVRSGVRAVESVPRAVQVGEKLDRLGVFFRVGTDQRMVGAGQALDEVRAGREVTLQIGRGQVRASSLRELEALVDVYQYRQKSPQPAELRDSIAALDQRLASTGELFDLRGTAHPKADAWVDATRGPLVAREGDDFVVVRRVGERTEVERLGWGKTLVRALTSRYLIDLRGADLRVLDGGTAVDRLQRGETIRISIPTTRNRASVRPEYEIVDVTSMRELAAAFTFNRAIHGFDRLADAILDASGAALADDAEFPEFFDAAGAPLSRVEVYRRARRGESVFAARFGFEDRHGKLEVVELDATQLRRGADAFAGAGARPVPLDGLTGRELLRHVESKLSFEDADSGVDRLRRGETVTVGIGSNSRELRSLEDLDAYATMYLRRTAAAGRGNAASVAILNQVGEAGGRFFSRDGRRLDAYQAYQQLGGKDAYQRTVFVTLGEARIAIPSHAALRRDGVAGVLAAAGASATR